MKKQKKSRLPNRTFWDEENIPYLCYSAAVDDPKHGYYENHTIYLILINSKLASHTWLLATEMDCADVDRRSLFSKRILKLSTYLKTNTD